MVRSMNGLTMAGAALVLLGLVGFAVPIFTTQHTHDVARVGDVALQAQDTHTHVIPSFLSGGAVLLGFVLIGAGALRRQ